MASTAVANEKNNDEIITNDKTDKIPLEEIKKSDSVDLIQSDKSGVITDDAPDSVSFNSPGPLRGTSKLKIETRRGYMIFEGRRANPEKNVSGIIGLVNFASTLRIIWDAAGNNDPYADWWLLKVEREIEEQESWITSKTEEYKSILDQYPNMTHEVSHSIKPIERDLRFSIPYSYRGAMLLMKHDELVKTIMTANHVGMVESFKAHNDIEKSSKAARKTFQAVAGYRFTGVNRDDVFVMNPVAQKAAELMGPCPSGILDDVVVPKFESSKSAVMRKLRLHKARAFEANQVNNKKS